MTEQNFLLIFNICNDLNKLFRNIFALFINYKYYTATNRSLCEKHEQIWLSHLAIINNIKVESLIRLKSPFTDPTVDSQ